MRLLGDMAKSLYDEAQEEWAKLAADFGGLDEESQEDSKRLNQGEITTAEYIGREIGRGGEGLGSIAAGAFQMVTPDAATDLLDEGMEYGMQKALETELGQDGLAYLKANPRIAKNLAAGVGALELGLPSALLAPVQRAIASAKNYIPNHYAPEIKNLKDMPDNFNSLTKKLLNYGVKGVKTEKEAFALAQKLTGLSDWASSGIKGGLVAAFSPSSRALYDKHGINSVSQKTVKDEMALAYLERSKGNTGKANRHKEKAVAQINYNKYITAQTGRKGKVADVLNNVIESVSYGGMQQLTKQNYINSAKQQKSTITSTGSRGPKSKKALEVSDEELGFVFESATKLWGIDPNSGDKLVVKRNTGVGGNHGSDAIAMKNKAHKRVKDLYTELGTDDPVALFLHMKANPIKGVGMITKTLEEVQERGLWLTSSQVGSAVVEGGINVMTKIMPNRKAMSFMSDQHDFLEKVPVLGKVLGRALPNRELTISPPIYSDLRAVADKTGDKKGKITLDKGQTGRVSDETIREYTDARPSRLDTALQVPKMAGESMLLGNALWDSGEEEEE
mgnify:CR=1 FL=1